MTVVYATVALLSIAAMLSAPFVILRIWSNPGPDTGGGTSVTRDHPVEPRPPDPGRPGPARGTSPPLTMTGTPTAAGHVDRIHSS